MLRGCKTRSVLRALIGNIFCGLNLEPSLEKNSLVKSITTDRKLSILNSSANRPRVRLDYIRVCAEEGSILSLFCVRLFFQSKWPTETLHWRVPLEPQCNQPCSAYFSWVKSHHLMLGLFSSLKAHWLKTKALVYSFFASLSMRASNSVRRKLAISRSFMPWNSSKISIRNSVTEIRQSSSQCLFHFSSFRIPTGLLCVQRRRNSKVLIFDLIGRKF